MIWVPGRHGALCAGKEAQKRGSPQGSSPDSGFLALVKAQTEGALRGPHPPPPSLGEGAPGSLTCSSATRPPSLSYKAEVHGPKLLGFSRHQPCWRRFHCGWGLLPLPFI